jgi:hypothetical protein
MKTVRVASLLARVCGATALLLGAFMWLGMGAGLRPMHMLLGFVLVLALWALSIVAASSNLYGLALLGILWGLVVAGLGSAQVNIMPGASHWVIQVVHLLVGASAAGLAEAIARRVRLRRQGAAVSPSAGQT